MWKMITDVSNKTVSAYMITVSLSSFSVHVELAVTGSSGYNVSPGIITYVIV